MIIEVEDVLKIKFQNFHVNFFLQVPTYSYSWQNIYNMFNFIFLKLKTHISIQRKWENLINKLAFQKNKMKQKEI
jgi:hypothetical protein